MQSPAFHPCSEIYKNYKHTPTKDINIYLSYGTGKETEKQDLPMIKILENKGYELKVVHVEGGDHSLNIWKPQLKEILLYLYKE